MEPFSLDLLIFLYKMPLGNWVYYQSIGSLINLYKLCTMPIRFTHFPLVDMK